MSRTRKPAAPFPSTLTGSGLSPLFPSPAEAARDLVGISLDLFASAIAPTGEEETPEAQAAERDLHEFSRQAWSIVRPGVEFVDGWVFGCMCEHGQALIEGEIKKLAVAIPPRHGKCVRRGTLVTMADGGLVPIESVCCGDRVVSSDGVSVTEDVVTGVLASGRKGLLRVTLSDGRLIDVTPEHRLYGWSDWVEAGDLRVGDPICVAEETPCGDNPMSRDDAFLLAFWISEGTKYRGFGTFQVTSASKSLVSRLTNVSHGRGWSVFSRGYCHSVSMASKHKGDTPINFLRKYRLWNKCTTHTARVPEEVMTAHLDAVREFVGTYIACDGHISRQAGTAGVASVSEGLVRDFQHLFTKMGVRSTVVKKRQVYKGEVRHFWECQVSSREALRRLSVEVEIPDKQHKLEELVIRKMESYTSDHGIPPDWRYAISGTKSRIRDEFGIRIDKKGWTDSEKVKSVADLTHSRQLLKKVSSGLAWRSVRSIEKIGEDDTFDIETRDHHAFFAGGVLSHNSLVFNVFMPVWSWIKKPANKYIFTAYSDSLVVRDSLACRDLIRSPWFQRRWGNRFAFKTDQNRQDQFTNNRGGSRIATTPGGTATGEGAHGIIADDIISVQNSFSAAAIEAAWKYWTQTMALRFENPEDLFRLVTMQRLRKNDLIGRLIAEKFGYDVLTLPFEAEPHRIYSFPDPAAPKKSEPKNAIVPTKLQRERPHLRDTRKAGEILWPERFHNAETIADLKKSVQAGAAGQLQQRPENDAGAVFKETKYKLFYPRTTDKGLCFLMDSTDKPRIVWASECAWYQTCDTAMKAEQANDETAFATFAKSKQGDLLVFHAAALRLMSSEQWPVMKHFRYGVPEWDEAQREVTLAGKLRPWPRPLMFQSVEGKNSGITLLQLARSEGYPLKELEADTNKVLRAATAAQLYESGHVYHNAEGSWRGKLEDQLSTFPAGQNDDLVDCVSYGAILFVHDNLLAAYTGPLVYNERVHQELDALDELRKANNEGAWIPPHLRPPDPTESNENLDELLAALQGRPVPRPPVVDDTGVLRPEFLHDED